MKQNILIRIGTINDLTSIVDIYNQAIKSRCATGDMDEFTVEERIDWFKKFDPASFPIYVAELDKKVVGYCTISPYRSGRRAMETIAEISYYLDYAYHGNGIGTALINHAISDCKRIGKKSLLAILLDINFLSIGLLEKLKFKKWGHFPEIVEMNGLKCGQLIYGLKLSNANESTCSHCP